MGAHCCRDTPPPVSVHRLKSDSVLQTHGQQVPPRDIENDCEDMHTEPVLQPAADPSLCDVTSPGGIVDPVLASGVGVCTDGNDHFNNVARDVHAKPFQDEPCPKQQVAMEQSTDSAHPMMSTWEAYTGIWHRANDMKQMAEILEDGTLCWASSFVADLCALRLTDGHVEMVVDGSTFIGELRPASDIGKEGDMLQWSDGERWIRGFEPYVGYWFNPSDVLCCGIRHDGVLVWNTEAREEVRTSVTADAGLTMHLKQKVYAARLENNAPSGVVQLRWDDGELWHRKPVAESPA